MPPKKKGFLPAKHASTDQPAGVESDAKRQKIMASADVSSDPITVACKIMLSKMPNVDLERLQEIASDVLNVASACSGTDLHRFPQHSNIVMKVVGGFLRLST